MRETIMTSTLAQSLSRTWRGKRWASSFWCCALQERGLDYDLHLSFARVSGIGMLCTLTLADFKPGKPGSSILPVGGRILEATSCSFPHDPSPKFNLRGIQILACGSSLWTLRSFGTVRIRVLIRKKFARRGFGGLRDGSFPKRACSSGAPMETAQFPEASIDMDSVENNYKIGGRYCILLTGHASDYTTRLYGGYAQMFVKLLGDPHDTWDIYPVVDGEFPPDEALELYDGFVVTGSRHDAHGSEEWISKLCTLLHSLHTKKQKVLGICFGHQVLSRALGGKTGRSSAGWELGARNVMLTDAICSKRYGLGVPSVIRVLEVHQDQVSEVPPGGELLGSSDETGIEMFAVGEHALGIQGHPEFSEDVVQDLIETRHANGILKEEEAKRAKASLLEGAVDQKTLQDLCKAFLKRGR